MAVYLDRNAKPREFKNHCSGCLHEEKYNCIRMKKSCATARDIYGFLDCSKFSTKPRYDDVYRNGVKWLDSL